MVYKALHIGFNSMIIIYSLYSTIGPINTILQYYLKQLAYQILIPSLYVSKNAISNTLLVIINLLHVEKGTYIIV